MNYLLSKDDLTKVLDYLATKPWAEANPYIGILAKLKPEQATPIVLQPPVAPVVHPPVTTKA